MDDKGIQIGSPEHELRRLLRENGFPEPEKIERVPHTNLAGHKTHWLHFRIDRKNGTGTKSTNMGHGFRITFTAPVRGPIALGYGAHFGLGLFVPPNGKRE
jgi:CRISPR-associated protein Csb2